MPCSRQYTVCASCNPRRIGACARGPRRIPPTVSHCRCPMPRPPVRSAREENQGKEVGQTGWPGQAGQECRCRDTPAAAAGAQRRGALAITRWQAVGHRVRRPRHLRQGWCHLGHRGDAQSAPVQGDGAAETQRPRAQPVAFQSRVTHLPAASEILLMDRSWYNRAGVERVLGCCTGDAVILSLPRQFRRRRKSRRDARDPPVANFASRRGPEFQRTPLDDRCCSKTDFKRRLACVALGLFQPVNGEVVIDDQ